jgi:3-methyladenine DNA glycosylase AlkD
VEYREVIDRLKTLSDPDRLAGMATAGIKVNKALGVSIPDLRKLAKEIGRDHRLALQLWRNPTHEVKILATMIDDPRQVTEEQMESWAADFHSWDLCDQCCNNLFCRTRFAWTKAEQWADRPEELVRRAGFVLMATLAVHDTNAADRDFIKFFGRIRDAATDERNFVKKAVNWALRQIGKRNHSLNQKAIGAAELLSRVDHPAARWISAAALQELTSDKVRARLT